MGWFPSRSRIGNAKQTQAFDRWTSPRRFQGAFAVAGVLAFVGAASCSSDRSSDKQGNGTSFAASDASRSELGVVSWNATLDGDVMKIDGVVRDGTVAAHLESRMFSDGQERHVVMTASLGNDTMTAAFATTKTGDGRPALAWDNSPRDAPMSRALLLLQADLSAATPVQSPPHPQGGSLVGKSLRPGLKPTDDPSLVNGQQCTLLHQCNGVSQALLCAKNAGLDLGNCSIKGVIEKPVKIVWSLLTSGWYGSNPVECPQSLVDFTTNCLGGNETGPADHLGNGKCQDGYQCDTDTPPPEPPCPNEQHTDCRQGCNAEGSACLDTKGLPCASDDERRTWCCNGGGDPTTNICRSTCQGVTSAGGATPSGKGQPCCSGLITNGGGDCVSSCQPRGGSCNPSSLVSDCCQGSRCDTQTSTCSAFPGEQ
ncbi:MAG: hypothetical protein JWO86_6769 [Myxococcaceae bacterium]|nr:hypothetical protein [Myxococcaceae bacterium]